MSVTLRTIYPNQLYQLQITDVAGDLEILRYTYASQQLSSLYLPATAIAILQARWNLLTTVIPNGAVNNFASLLGGLIYASDPGGVIPFYFSASGGRNFVYAAGLIPEEVYYFSIGIPNSADLWLVGSPVVAPPF